jgi:type VI secretion system ImpB/VipA family protein
MPPFNFGEIKIAVDGDTSQARPVPETPFRVLLLGDFSGHGRKQPLPARQPTLVDRDNFDDILAALYPELKLRLGDDDLATVQFSALADFHPDRLFECVDLFRKLREMRARLADPATFADAAAELGLPGPAAKPHEAAQATTPQASPFALGSLLDEMIEQTEARAQTRAPAESDLQKFVRRVTEPHLVSVPTRNSRRYSASSIAPWARRCEPCCMSPNSRGSKPRGEQSSCWCVGSTRTKC